MKKIAAFFDLDGTLYRNSLMIDHLKKLIKYEIINQDIWINYLEKSYNKWADRKQDYDKFLEKSGKYYVKAIKNIKKEYLDFCAKRLVALKGNRVYTYTRDIIKEHIKKGHLVIFISGSPDFIVEQMAKKYHAHIFAGTEYIIKNDKFSGEIIPLWDSDSKNKKMDELVQKYDIDLNSSYAYGDTNGDFTMLNKVGNPVTINPSNELLLRIKQDKKLSRITKIIVERKDNIYLLDSSVNVKNREK